MVRKYRFPEFSFRGEMFLLFALMLLILPLQWVCAFFTAALWHEFCHCASVYLCGSRIDRISISSGGAVMDTPPLSPICQLICTLAGPVGGFILLFWGRSFPRLALCGVVHSLYNLLPLLPLDGGRVLSTVMQTLFPQRAEAICTAVAWGTRIFLLGISLLITVTYELGILTFLCMVRLVLPNHVKTPCNKLPERVQ